MIEGGATPLSSAESLSKMGFNIILYPLSVLYANTFATMNILTELKKSGNTSKYKQKVVNFDQFNDLVELPKFRKMEKKYEKSKK
jgi:methylisocitrate lyase